MQLKSNWRDVVKKAWSIRLIALAGLLSGVEVALPLLQDYVPIHPGIFAALSMIIVSLAFISRIVAQENLKDD